MYAYMNQPGQESRLTGEGLSVTVSRLEGGSGRRLGSHIGVSVGQEKSSRFQVAPPAQIACRALERAGRKYHV